MSKMLNALEDIRFLDDLGGKTSPIHKIHPLAKLLTTFTFLIMVVSFGKYEVSGLMPLILFPVSLLILSDTPVKPILKSVLIAMPLVIGVGLFNPLIDQATMLSIGPVSISGGWISFASILIKGLLTIFAAFILVATTGMNKIALALRLLRVPKLFVVQLLLTYRYITVLLEEVSRAIIAYSLRSPFQKGIKFKDWGPLMGQLLNRTIDRAGRIYTSMCCRGFEGEYKSGQTLQIKFKDLLYTFGWILFFIGVRYINIAQFIGLFMTEVLT